MPAPNTVYRFYLDDSGSRDPDKARSTEEKGPDWFALGGVLIKEDAIAEAEAVVIGFRARWPNPAAPLHSSDIRFMKGGFSWLRSTSGAKRSRFVAELTDVMTSLPISVHACVVDRPGYNKRYLTEYGPRRWLLCRTAFNIAVERAAKFALHDGGRLRVYAEQSDKRTEGHLRGYYSALRTVGLPFNASTSGQYAPLSAGDLAGVLMEFRIKTKASVMMQVADLALWPVCRGRYEPDNKAYQAFVQQGKLLDAKCPLGSGLYGIKYSCFD